MKNPSYFFKIGFAILSGVIFLAALDSSLGLFGGKSGRPGLGMAFLGLAIVPLGLIIVAIGVLRWAIVKRENKSKSK
jgi:hypothetical protein